MKKLFSVLTSILTISFFTSNLFAAGDAENVKKLSSFKKTGTQAGIVIPQDTKFAANIIETKAFSEETEALLIEGITEYLEIFKA